MPKKEYQWCIGKTPPEIEVHSLAKHRVYEEYISHYIQVSYANPNIPQANIAMIDAFSGGGVYTHPLEQHALHEGSPIRIIKAAEAAAAAINVKRKQAGIRKSFQLNTKYYFVDQNKNACKYLGHYLNEIGLRNESQRQIQIVNGEFEQKIDKIIRDVSKHTSVGRAIFILDQCGWSYAPFDKIRLIFEKLPKAEVILTFATDWLMAYISEKDTFLKAYERTGLQDVFPVKRLIEIKEENRHWRGLIQFYLHRHIRELSGASFYTPFFIRSDAANRTFWLLHLSGHARARDVMTDLHWQIKNQFSHALGRGINMFGYDPMHDSKVIGIQDFFQQPECKFDDLDYEFSRQEILGELPFVLDQYRDGIAFSQLYQKIANHTPATMELLKEVIGFLISYKAVMVMSKEKKQRRKPSTIRNDDVIRLSKQRSFFLFSDGKEQGFDK
ncbi:MAG: three-Cys-motif partner protein TcmP, partial [Gammaproteobacteria bacterium]|nr:three-Cys-motif partner protein TcmP [Gammaproteobacteria bacterium]